MGMAHNPPYYGQFVEDAGFAKLTDYLSGHIHRGTYDLPDRVYQLVERVKERRGFWVKNFKDKQEMRQWVARIRDVYNESFVDVPGFYPITDEELQVVADRLASLTYPELVKLVMMGDEVVGFLLAYPNISAALQKAQGKLWPFGWFHIWRERRRTKWVDLNGIGLLPEVQGVGANTLLYAEIGDTLRASAFDCSTFCRAASASCVATCLRSIACVNSCGKSRSLIRKSTTSIEKPSSCRSSSACTAPRICSRFGATATLLNLTVSFLKTWKTRGATTRSKKAEPTSV